MSQQTPPQQQIMQQQLAVQQAQPQQVQPRMNTYQQLSQSIEACNKASHLFKSNVRRLIDDIQIDLNGPPLE